MSKQNPLNIHSLHNEVVKKHLEEYGTWSFEKTQEAITRVQVGQQWYSLGFQETCRDAVALIERAEYHGLKFEMLIKKMKENGLNHFYEHMMGEHIDKAVWK